MTDVATWTTPLRDFLRFFNFWLRLGSSCDTFESKDTQDHPSVPQQLRLALGSLAEVVPGRHCAGQAREVVLRAREAAGDATSGL